MYSSYLENDRDLSPTPTVPSKHATKMCTEKLKVSFAFKILLSSLVPARASVFLGLVHDIIKDRGSNLNLT